MSAQDFFCGKCPHCRATIRVCTDGQKVALRMLCNDLAAQVQWPPDSGSRITPKKWKQLLMAAWERTRDPDLARDINFLPAIDGDGYDAVCGRDDRLPTTEMSELLEYGNAWAAEQGVERR